jgi:hypothetical protein
MLDLFRSYAQDTSLPLAGRKYVCQRCGDGIAKAFGYHSTEAERKANAEAEAYKGALVGMRHRLESFTSELNALAADPVSNLMAVTASAGASEYAQEHIKTQENPIPVVAKVGRPRKVTSGPVGT